MTEQEYEVKLKELKKQVDEVYYKSFDKPLEEGWNWYCNHPLTKEYEKLYREYKVIKVPKLNPQNELDKECLMSFKEFEKWCKVGPIFTDYDGSGVYATKDKVSDIYIIPSDIISGIFRKDFDYVCWYNK